MSNFKSLACPVCAVGGGGLEKRLTIFYVATCIVPDVCTDDEGRTFLHVISKNSFNAKKIIGR